MQQPPEHPAGCPARCQLQQACARARAPNFAHHRRRRAGADVAGDGRKREDICNGNRASGKAVADHGLVDEVALVKGAPHGVVHVGDLQGAVRGERAEPGPRRRAPVEVVRVVKVEVARAVTAGGLGDAARAAGAHCSGHGRGGGGRGRTQGREGGESQGMGGAADCSTVARLRSMLSAHILCRCTLSLY
jgi:hypothetical protein